MYYTTLWLGLGSIAKPTYQGSCRAVGGGDVIRKGVTQKGGILSRRVANYLIASLYKQLCHQSPSSPFDFAREATKSLERLEDNATTIWLMLRSPTFARATLSLLQATWSLSQKVTKWLNIAGKRQSRWRFEENSTFLYHYYIGGNNSIGASWVNMQMEERKRRVALFTKNYIVHRRRLNYTYLIHRYT